MVFNVHGDRSNDPRNERDQLIIFVSLCRFISNRKLTDKVDVYAFGIVLLELISAQPPFVKNRPENLRRIDNWVCPKPCVLAHDSQVTSPVLTTVASSFS